jgi:pimeloyl-ACP methyl ester carboxylesterase
VLEQHLDGAKRFSPAALTGYYESMMVRPDRTSVLKETALPVLFLLGRHDTAVPIEDGLKQCHLPRLSYIHILENAGHMGMIEEPQTCNRVLNEFVFFVNEHRP